MTKKINNFKASEQEVIINETTRKTYAVDAQGDRGDGTLHFYLAKNCDTLKSNMVMALCENGRMSDESRYPLNMVNYKLDREIMAYGIKTDFKTAAKIVKHLDENCACIPENYEYEKMGFTKDGRAFKGSEFVQANGEEVYLSNNKNHLRTDGSYNKWKQMVDDYIIGKTIAEVLLVASFTAPIVDLLQRDNIILNVFGDTSLGKTTIAKLFTSVWSAINDEKLVQTWDATEIGLTDFIKTKRAVPVVIEDGSLMDDAMAKKMRTLIYRLKDGTARLRSGYGKKAVDSEKSHTLILMNSEVSLLKLIKADGKYQDGVFGRLIEIGVLQHDLTADAKEANAIESVLKKNYGLAGNKFIRFLFNKNFSQTTLTRRYEKEVAEVRGKIDIKNNIMCRLAEEIAVITLTAKLIKEGLELDVEPKAIRNILIEICANNVREYATVSTVKKKSMNDLYVAVLDRFTREGVIKNTKGGECVCIRSKDIEDYVVHIEKTSFRAFTKYLCDEEFISHYKSLDNRKTLNIDLGQGKNERCICFLTGAKGTESVIA